MPPYQDLGFGDSERVLRRRRLLSAVVLVVAMSGIAGGSAVAAVASAHDDRADHSMVSPAD